MSTQPALHVALGHDLRWCAEQVAAHHYLGTVPDPRTRPLAYTVAVAGERVGCVWFGRPEASACYQGRLTYGSERDVQTLGRAIFDRWEVLCLSRLWLSPDVQAGGRLFCEELLPGFRDRKGTWRSGMASEVLRTAADRIVYDYLVAHPPVWVDQPYRIRVVLSYCDTRRHKGTVYKAAGWDWARTNDDGIETWFTGAVRLLTEVEDSTVRQCAATDSRGVAIRQRHAHAFTPMLGGWL